MDARIYTCGDAGAVRAGMTVEELRGVDATLAYVSRATPAAVQAARAGTATASDEVLSLPDGKAWVKKQSADGIRIVSVASSPCGDGALPTLTRP